MTTSAKPTPYPPAIHRCRAAALAMACTLMTLAIACGRDRGTTSRAVDAPAEPAGAPAPAAAGSAAATGSPAAAAAPATPLPPMAALRLPSPGATKPAADAEKGNATAPAPGRSGSEAIEARALQAAALYDGGDGAQAERIYRDLLKDHPDHVASLVGLAQIMIDRDDLAGAGAANARALVLNPQSIPALRQKIALLIARDQTAEAVRLAESSLRLDANSAALYSAIGDAQRAYGDLPKAIDAYRKAVGLNPGGAPGWTRLGEALAENGDAAMAHTALASALELNPESYPAYRALARLYYDNGQPEQAVDAWERALRLQPDRGEAQEGIAEALLAAKRPAEARPHAEAAQRQGRDVRALLQQINLAAAGR